MRRLLLVLLLLSSLQAFSQHSTLNAQRYTAYISMPRGYVSGMLVLLSEEECVKGSLFNEFGITALDFTYDRKKNKVKLHSVVKMMDRLRDFFEAEDNNTNIQVLYPNPVRDELHLILWSDGFAMNDIEVFDLMGRKLYSQKVVLMEGENYLDLSCPYASGIYVLRFGNKTQKIVIQ